MVVARSNNFGLFKSLFIALSITLVGCSKPTTETSVSGCFDSTIISLSDDYQALASIDSEEAIYILASSHSDTDAFNTKPNYRLYQFTETAGQRNLKMLADVDGIEVSQGFAESADLLMVDNGVLYFTAYSSEFGVEL